MTHSVRAKGSGQGIKHTIARSVNNDNSMYTERGDVSNDTRRGPTRDREHRVLVPKDNALPCGAEYMISNLPDVLCRCETLRPYNAAQPVAPVFVVPLLRRLDGRRAVKYLNRATGRTYIIYALGQLHDISRGRIYIYPHGLRRDAQLRGYLVERRAVNQTFFLLRYHSSCAVSPGTEYCNSSSTGFQLVAICQAACVDDCGAMTERYSVLRLQAPSS